MPFRKIQIEILISSILDFGPSKTTTATTPARTDHERTRGGRPQRSRRGTNYNFVSTKNQGQGKEHTETTNLDVADHEPIIVIIQIVGDLYENGICGIHFG